MLKQGISPVLSKEFNKPNWMKGGKKKNKQKTVETTWNFKYFHNKTDIFDMLRLQMSIF